MQVLSLFDGISCGKQALDSLGIECEYMASEIDKYAISVSEHRHPSIIQMGDVQAIEPAGCSWDLLIGGSPCQSFSSSGHQQGFDGESKLFWEYIRVLNQGSFKYFMLENVSMKKEWLDIITKELGVEPVYIDSRVFGAQSRKRYYWTNIPLSAIPTEDSSETVSDILEIEVDNKYYLSDNTVNRIRNSRTGGTRFIDYSTKKARTILASYSKLPSDAEYIEDELGYRKYTPLEFERLQGLPDNYTDILSDTRRYQTVGNGWHIPTIKFLFSHFGLGLSC